jgi:hypothetical protein
MSARPGGDDTQISSLMDVSEETKTFILLNFHTYASELSDVLMGGNPKYDFGVLYKMESDDDAIVHSLEESCI